MSVNIISGPVTLTVPVALANMSNTIKYQLESCPTSEVFISEKYRVALPFIVSYLKKFPTGLPTESIYCRDDSIPLQPEDDEFLLEIQAQPNFISLLFQIATAANYLEIPHLVDIMGKGIASQIKKCSTSEEILKLTAIPPGCPLHE
jgi:hypothetical protein